MQNIGGIVKQLCNRYKSTKKMAPKKVEELIIKFLNKSINENEWKALNSWYEKYKNEQLLYDYSEINYVIDDLMKEFNTERTKNSLIKKIKKDKRLSFNYNLIKYAAAIVVFISTSYVFFNKYASENPNEIIPIIVDTKIDSGTDKAILTLGDGSEVELNKGEDFQTQNASSNGKEIIYDHPDDNKTDIVYNYLTIPRGGQFSIILSDGTHVWLNSDSQLKYPENFINGQTREVELVYGEAYFDVSPSTNHNGSKFKVFNKSQEIEVLGTEFNIKAYRNETNIYTTLVEGKVSVDIDGKNQILKPSEQSLLNIETNEINIKVVDVYNEISWKDGIFTFEGKPLKDIAIVLSRWYDIDFVFENENAKEKRFNGSLKRNLKINEILDIIKNFEKIKDYEINKKTIVIK